MTDRPKDQSLVDTNQFIFKCTAKEIVTLRQTCTGDNEYNFVRKMDNESFTRQYDIGSTKQKLTKYFQAMSLTLQHMWRWTGWMCF